jgi:SAM-dependent methyltransferase
MSATPNVWDEVFRRQGHVFREPHEDLTAVVEPLRARGAATVLDLGCGTGRHLVALARAGFAVHGLDDSPEGIALARDWLAAEGLSADIRLGNMLERLPYDDAFFDAVISVQVIHHGTIAAIRGIVAEMTRVLKVGGLVFVTVPSLRNQATAFEEIEPGTLVPLDGKEAGLPHHYFTPDELQRLFGDFGYDVGEVHLDRVRHYCLTAIKR